jgi:hypothetical protein
MLRSIPIAMPTNSTPTKGLDRDGGRAITRIAENSSPRSTPLMAPAARSGGVAEPPGDPFDGAQTLTHDRDVARGNVGGDECGDGLLGGLVRRQARDGLTDVVEALREPAAVHAHLPILPRA